MILIKIKNRLKRFFSEFYKVPYCVPNWGIGEHLTWVKCVVTGRIVKGSHLDCLRERVKEKTGKPFIFGFNSGREAILAALRAWGIGDNDAVIMPSYCCETVAQAVKVTGAAIVFCDIDDDFNPDVEHILTLIDPRVRAIIFPHMFGNPGRIDKLDAALTRLNIRSTLLLIDDAAQSFGARLNGRLVGTFGDAGIISFGPGKTMTATGGGLIITDREDLAKRIEGLSISLFPVWKKFRKTIYWFVFRRWRRFTLPFYPFLNFYFRNLNGKKETISSMCNVDAAIGLKQLKKLDTMLYMRIERKKKLDAMLSPCASSLWVLPENNNPEIALNVATKYLLRFRNNNFPELKELFENVFLKRCNIEILDLYQPIHLKFNDEKLPLNLLKTEASYKGIMQIPVDPIVSENDFKKILDEMERYISNQRRY